MAILLRMKPASAPFARLLLCIALAATAPDAASEAAKPDAAATVAAPAGSPVPGVDPDLAALDAELADEKRALKTASGEFAVFVRTAPQRPAQGVLLLVPGDGTHPTSAAALEQLRRTLPVHGWSSWLLTLPPPPLSWSARLDAAPTPGAPAAVPQGPEEAGTPDQDRSRALRAWAAACESRIAAALASATAEQPRVVLVGEGSAAALVTAAMGASTPAASGAVLLEPVELHELPADWPEELGAPVLEVLSPALAYAEGDRRRASARDRQVRHFRLLTLPTDDWSPGRGETMLAQRLRGWLKSLDAAPGRGGD